MSAERPLKRAILLAGPTTSGKSALGLALAERLGGVVINADSMQIYRDLCIITARPSREDEARVPHRLYGHVDAAENYSVGRWLSDARAALAQAESNGWLPIFVGGTGLYFKALTRGLSAVPAIPLDIRAAARARLRAEGAGTLHAELSRRDPASARQIRPADGVRIVRALEVLEATGTSLHDWHRGATAPTVDSDHVVKVFLDVPREELYARIARRFDAMLTAGALAEVAALDARGLDPLLPAMKAHGVPWLRRHLRGEIPLEDAAEGGKKDTRHYTKRQKTWFRHQMRDWLWLAPTAAQEAIVSTLAACP